MNSPKELLDFCRVKKIFDKGFGFLTSLYHEGNVFFHFSDIKDKATKEKLAQKQRGVVYLYYISVKKGEKRKVARAWSDVKNIDKNLIPDFIKKITEEFNLGGTNLFELAGVVNQLRETGYISEQELVSIFHSEKVLGNITVVIPMLLESEKEIFGDMENYIDNKLEAGMTPAGIASEIIKGIYKK